jgi:hypothetical protein
MRTKFWSEHIVRGNFGDLGIHVKIILRHIFRKYVKVWTGFN